MTKSTYYWVFLCSIALAVALLNPSCKKEDDNIANPSSSPSVDDAEDYLNPNLSYGSVTDQDANTYATIVIGGQEWMAENLRTKTYCNGDTISHIPDETEWTNTQLSLTPGWCYYDNNSQYDQLYGKLYNYFAVDDTRNICPCNWHVPTNSEWAELIDYLGGTSIAGGKMKSSGAGLWVFDGEIQLVDGTNESGFTGLPGGYRNGANTDNGFFDIGIVGGWWSSTGVDTGGIYRELGFNSNSVFIGGDEGGDPGYSVRCIKD